MKSKPYAPPPPPLKSADEDRNLCAPQKTPRAAIVLSGCGVFDGSEIHEAVIALLNLQKRGVETEFFAPDTEQADVVNHLDSIAMQPRRNALVESARIARGHIRPLAKYDAGEFDLLLFVGGFGAAKTLCTFAADGADCKVNKHVESAIVATLAKKKALAFMCIAPVLAAKVIGNGIRLTIGNDPSTAKALEAMGAKHVDCPANSFVEDSSKRVYSTPAYMLAKSTPDIDAGVGAMLDAILKNV